MFGFMRQDNFRRHLAMAHDKLPKGANEQGKTECCKSGRCCWTGPCELSPTDPPRLAAHLGMTETDLFAEYLVVDDAREGAGLRVIPRRKEQEGGHFLSDDETYDVATPCVFLTDENECRVHAAKPTGGAVYKCWDPNTGGVPRGVEWTEDQVKALGWDGDRWRDD